MLTLLALGVAVMGVPHGALDHWTGRSLLHQRVGVAWPAVFFPAYLLSAALTIIGWYVATEATVLAFVLFSAWHFGVEDGFGRGKRRLSRVLPQIAAGGLVIWLPALTQADILQSWLVAIIPGSSAAVANSVVNTLQWLAAFLVPIGLFHVFVQVSNRSTRPAGVALLAMTALFSVADVLLSFGVYFCGWHSLRGLGRLKNEFGLSWRRLAIATAPLTLASCTGAAVGLIIWRAGVGLDIALLRSTFVVLSALAVPHLLLHGPISQWLSSSNDALTTGSGEVHSATPAMELRP